MSLEVTERVAGLRALAHPLRLQMLSVLTGAAMSAAELARELHISQALASYHLRQLVAAELLDLAEVRSQRGGQERRYRYRLPPTDTTDLQFADDAALALFVEAVCGELRRRSQQRASGSQGLSVDAELWVRPQDWEHARDAVKDAATGLHRRARRPHEPGVVHVNTTVLMFQMTDRAGPSAP